MQVHQQQVREAVDCCNKVVEVVSESARQPTDRIHFLGVQQLLLQVLAFGYVPGVYDDSGYRLISEEVGIGRLDRAPGTVPMLDAQLRRNSGLGALVPPVPGRGYGPHIARMDQSKHALANQFLGRVPKDPAGGWTCVSNETFRSQDSND